MDNRRLRFLTYFIMGYMLLAFVWWSVLLYTKNKDAYQAKIELQQLGMAAEGLIETPADFLASERYQNLLAKYRQQERMIIGETIFLSISLLVGIFIIYRGYRHQVQASEQQRNFLLSITHELKSPLAGIRLALETIKRRKGRLTEEQVERLAGSGIKETDRLHKLVEDLLLSARLETAYQFHREPINLAQLLEAATHRQRQRTPEMTLELSVASDLPLVVGDQQALESVVVNLIENAVKYSPAPAQVEVDIRATDDQVVLKVADQGVGIKSREKEQIFEKFYRVGSEDTRKTKGTGLGLFIVREIINAHQGSVQVRNNSPQGTIFEVRLPAHAVPKIAEEVPVG